MVCENFFATLHFFFDFKILELSVESEQSRFMQVLHLWRKINDCLSRHAYGISSSLILIVPTCLMFSQHSLKVQFTVK